MATTTWPAEVYVFDGTHWVSISPHGMTTLPPATGTTIGGVIVGAGINVAPDGTISVTHFSGDYNDLTNKPVIQAPVQSDWLATGGDAFIVNKPNFLSQFTNDLKVSAFPNDALYVDAAAAAAAAPIQSIAAGANVAISDDGHGNIVIAATGGGGGTPGGVVSVSGTAPIKVVDGTHAPTVSLVIGAGLKVNSGALEADFSGLATVATSGSYNDLSDKPTIPPTYTLPTASGTVLGGVKVGTGLTMTGEVLSANVTTVPDASTTTKGIIQIADAANITAGTALRAVDAAGLKAVTDQQTKDFVNVSGDTMTGTLVIPDGTAAAPSLKFDDATGVYQPAANTWAVSTAGVERLRVRADGNVGIGVAGAANILIDGKTDQAFLARLESTNNYSTGLYDGRCGYRIANATNGPFYCEMYLDPTAKTYGFGGSSSGGSLPIIGGAAQSDIVVSPKSWVAFNEPALATLGTASAPSVSIFGDEDTGTFSPAANTWAVSTGGTERLRVLANGHVAMSQSAKVSATSPSAAENGLTIRHDHADNSQMISAYGYAPDVSVKNIYGVWSQLGSTAPAGTHHAGVWACFFAGQTAAGSGTVIDEIRCFSAGDQVAATEAHAFHTTMAQRPGKSRYALYLAGTAPSYVNGQIQTSLGTAAAPSVAYSGDADTGTWSPGANTWAVSTGGVERLRVRADGNVGIGASGDSATRLKIAGTTVNYGVRMDVGASASSSTYDGILVVSSSAVGSVTGSSSGIRITGSGAICDNFRGVNVTSVPASTTNLCIGVSASVSAGNNRWAFYSDGGADSYSSGNWRFAVGRGVESATGQASTQFPDNDKFAISAGGTERLRVKSTGGVKYVPLAAAPATPDEGEVYFDSTTKKLRVYDGTAWIDLH